MTSLKQTTLYFIFLSENKFLTLKQGTLGIFLFSSERSDEFSTSQTHKVAFVRAPNFIST